MNIYNYLSQLRRKISRSDMDYSSRLQQELDTYTSCLDVNALPEIFHYWSDTYVRPMLEEVGASNPDQFFARYLMESASRTNSILPEFVSVGAGNCDTEVRVAKLLQAAGLTEFVVHCLDINPAMLERGQELAESEGVLGHIKPLMGDFNHWRPQRKS